MLIAGAGIAAAAAAIRLCELGITPIMLRTVAKVLPGIEAIPDIAFPLLKELGLDRAAAEAGGRLFENFEIMTDEVRETRHGLWLQVDRRRFADCSLRAALARGARMRFCDRIPPLSNCSNYASVVANSIELRGTAALDATGRSAVWSRPLSREGTEVAEIYEMQNPIRQDRGAILRSDHTFWSYAIGSTVGVIQENRGHASEEGRAFRRWATTAANMKYVGRRAAFVQWAQRAIDRRRIAIGDSLLAHSPLAGRGIHFALVTANLAGLVVKTWMDEGSTSTATAAFFEDLARDARDKHLTTLCGQPLTRVLSTSGPLSPMHFSANLTRGNVLGRNRANDSGLLQLPDGSSVRWLGKVDLLTLRRFRSPTKPEIILREVMSAGVSKSQAWAVVEWCLRHQVLSVAESEFATRT